MDLWKQDKKHIFVVLPQYNVERNFEKLHTSASMFQNSDNFTKMYFCKYLVCIFAALLVEIGKDISTTTIFLRM